MSAGVHRLPPRRTGARLWAMRLLGVLATGALLAVGIVAAVTVLPERADEPSLLEEAPAATSEPAAEQKPRKPKLTRKQRRARAAAVGVLRDNGYRPVSLSDYKPRRTLRVLIGRGDGGQRAFFFAGGRYVGNDAPDDSHRLRVVRQRDRSITLSYAMFRPDDEPCCPGGGTARVRFRWDGQALGAQTAIPPSYERRAPEGF